MTDVFDVRTRSRVMAAIGSKDTGPELIVRTFLHKRGFRFRLHIKELAGRPDIVLPRHKVALFVHGCFWHQHDGCALAAVPASNKEFWKKKLNGNRIRDLDRVSKLGLMGWRVGIFWECAVRKGTVHVGTLKALEKWLTQTSNFKEFPASPLRKKRAIYRRSRIR